MTYCTCKGRDRQIGGNITITIRSIVHVSIEPTLGQSESVCLPRHLSPYQGVLLVGFPAPELHVARFAGGDPHHLRAVGLAHQRGRAAGGVDLEWEADLAWRVGDQRGGLALGRGERRERERNW